MSAGFENGSTQAERLSALIDGETDAAASAAACAGWKSDAELRRIWHAWQLIGDVLRSDDLASNAAHDQRFLLALRERMAAEPVVLAPAPVPVAASGRLDADSRSARSSPRWLLPSAVAAGFMLVVGTFAVLRPGALPAPPAPALALADTTGVASSLRPVALREPVDPAPAVVVNGKLIRDARLDRYLAAHKQFAGSSALGLPSAFLRSATVDAEPR
ncbi:MAG: RseA family anti-sigma factor [Caldimonas sp.]